MNRLQARRDRNLPVELPSIESFEFIFENLEEIGLVNNGFNGHEPLNWIDVKSWSEMTNTNITPWTSKVVIKLSRQYCYQSHISTKRDCEAPYQHDVTYSAMVEVRRAADKKLRSLF